MAPASLNIARYPPPTISASYSVELPPESSLDAYHIPHPALLYVHFTS